MGAFTGDPSVQVLFECSPSCPRVVDKSRRGVLFEGAVVPHSVERTSWDLEIKPILEHEGYLLAGACLLWRYNGANGEGGNCCLRPAQVSSTPEAMG